MCIVKGCELSLKIEGFPNHRGQCPSAKNRPSRPVWDGKRVCQPKCLQVALQSTKENVISN